MAATIIQGREVAEQIRAQIKNELEELVHQGTRPGLAVIIVGEDPASKVYVANKEKACQKLGFYSEVHRLPEQTPEEELLKLIGTLNHRPEIHGILVQLPLPKHIREKKVIDAISPEKDVDGFHPVNIGNLMIGDKGFLPCTPAGIVQLIENTGMDISGKHAVVIGRSNIVGKPVAMLMLQKNATVTICHSKTVGIAQIAKQADILIVAVGRAKMVNRSFVKPGAVVIDVGVNRLEDGTLVGDVDFDDVKEVAGFITPVPGGVGPMTITMLLKNTLESAKMKAREKTE